MSAPLYIAYHPIYQHPLPENHRFPMAKYELLPQQLIYEGIAEANEFHKPAQCPDEILALTHDPAYINRLHNLELTDKEQRAIGFPQSEALIRREICIAQGTIDCALAALETGVGLNIAGGTHHAFTDKGEGFCILNDMAVAANYLLQKKLAQQIAIVDLDVHQGNGTASIFANKKEVYTFSMHGAHNYPFRKEISNRDIPLQDGIGDNDYLALLETNLNDIIKSVKPDFVFYLSGVDILSTDKFGKLNISLQGCAQRDKMVFEKLYQHKIPCAVAMGGGYSPQVSTIVTAHANTFKAAKAVWG